MIPVRQAPEPAYFDAEVRQPGRAFLNNHPDRELKTLWDVARDDLRRRYERICAYTCQRIVDGTIDHFLPKSKFRALAYEWSLPDRAGAAPKCPSLPPDPRIRLGLAAPASVHPSDDAWHFARAALAGEMDKG